MRLSRVLAAAILIGFMFATGWFACCYWLSQLPVVGPVSLSHSFYPWWRHWPIAAGLFCLPALASILYKVRRQLLDAPIEQTSTLDPPAK
jgi:hypothetical protein